MESKAVLSPPEANPPVAEEKSGGGSRWDQVRSAVLRRGWSLGKKVAIAGAAISCAPVVIPPLLFFSTLGLAVAFPFGVYLTSIACADHVMRSLLSPPPREEEEEEEGEFFEPEEMETEGEKEEENVPELDHDIEEKGDGEVVEEERQMEEAGMGEGKEVVEDNKEEECGGGTLFYYEDMRKDFGLHLVPAQLVCPHDIYLSEAFEDRNRVEIVTEEQLMEEMKMPGKILGENEKNQEDKVEGTAQGLPPTAFPFESVAPLEKEIELSSQYASADKVGCARLGAEAGGEEKMEEEMGGGEHMEAEAEVKEEEGLDAAAPKSKESVPSADEVLEDREVEIVPSLEHASDAMDGGDTGDRGLEEKGRTEGGVNSTAQNLPPSVDPSLVVAPQEKPMEEMEIMREELGAEQKGKNVDIVCSTLEHESKIKQSSLRLVYGSTFEKGYEGVVGIMEEEIPTEEVGLGEAYAVEEKGDERDVGIKEEEKLTEVGLTEAYVVEEKGDEGNVIITEEEKLTAEVEFGDAYAVEKGYGSNVGILEEEKPREEVGSGEAFAVKDEVEGDVGKMEEEKPTEEGLAEACAMEEKGYGGAVARMEEEKPTEEVGLGVATAVEEKRYEADIGTTEEKKPTEEVGLGEVSVVEEKGNESNVSLVEDKKLTEEVGLGEEREEKGKEDEGVDSADFESQNLLPSAYPSVAVAPEASKIEIEQSLECAADVREGSNRGSIGLMEEEKPNEHIEMREEHTTEEKGRKGDDVDASAQKPLQNVYPSNSAVLEEHEDSVKPSSLSSECPSMFKGNGYGECVETVEEEKLTKGAELGKEVEEVQKGEEAVDTAALESEKLLPSGYASVAALLEGYKAETEPSSELACDVKKGI